MILDILFFTGAAITITLGAFMALQKQRAQKWQWILFIIGKACVVASFIGSFFQDNV